MSFLETEDIEAFLVEIQFEGVYALVCSCGAAVEGGN
jgi:hypothetical protein